MDKDWTLRTLKEYLRIPSVSAQRSGITKSVRFLVRLFNSVGLATRVITSGGNPVVYAERIVGRSAKTILFYNHYDVQPPEPLEKWETPPFTPTIRRGKLFARGASDNKGNLIARLTAVSGFAGPLNIKFLVEGEEEVGSPTLPRFIRKYADLIRADLCIWESGGRDEHNNPDLTLGCKGICHLELVVRSAKSDLHSSKGVIVPNPAWRLIWALNTLKGPDEIIHIAGFYRRVKPPTAREKALLAHQPFYEPEKRQRWGIRHFLKSLTGPALKERYFFSPALNINGLTSGYHGAGHKTVLPRQASAKIDFRLVPDQRPDEIIRLLRQHLDKYGFSDIIITNARGYPPARTPSDSPYVRLVQSVQERIYRKPVIVEPMMAASGPMYLFTPLMPCLSVGVGYTQANIHAPNENIRLHDLWLGIDVIRGIIKSVGQYK